MKTMIVNSLFFLVAIVAINTSYKFSSMGFVSGAVLGLFLMGAYYLGKYRGKMNDE